MAALGLRVSLIAYPVVALRKVRGESCVQVFVGGAMGTRWEYRGSGGAVLNNECHGSNLSISGSWMERCMMNPVFSSTPKAGGWQPGVEDAPLGNRS